MQYIVSLLSENFLPKIQFGTGNPRFGEIKEAKNEIVNMHISSVGNLQPCLSTFCSPTNFFSPQRRQS